MLYVLNNFKKKKTQIEQKRDFEKNNFKIQCMCVDLIHKNIRKIYKNEYEFLDILKWNNWKLKRFINKKNTKSITKIVWAIENTMNFAKNNRQIQYVIENLKNINEQNFHESMYKSKKIRWIDIQILMN